MSITSQLLQWVFFTGGSNFRVFRNGENLRKLHAQNFAVYAHACARCRHAPAFRNYKPVNKFCNTFIYSYVKIYHRKKYPL